MRLWAGVRLGRDYLEIVLRLRKLVPGWVESYVGPPELLAAVDADQEFSAAELCERVDDLANRVQGEELEPDRERWLVAQLRAISTALLWLEGERIDYATLFERCHGARVALVADRQFEQAHALLDRALPGPGAVPGRWRTWRETQLIPVSRLQESLELLAGEMRVRCRKQFGLPRDERVIWEVVSDEPWAANAEDLGGHTTRIRINSALPISSPRLLELVCHEAYPGHHTETVCKDARLIQPLGREELAVYVYPSPQAVISEGMACYAMEALLGDDAERIAADCLRPTGIAYDHETAAAVRRAEDLLLPVRSNIALMLDAAANSAQAREYARTWLRDEPEQIDKAIADLESRSWLPYESCYPVGLTLCRRYVAADPRRFRDLLTRQLTPADLAL